MSYRKAYLHLFSRMSDIIERLDTSEEGEELNFSLLLKQMQAEGEEIVVSDTPMKASRSGGTM